MSCISIVQKEQGWGWGSHVLKEEGPHWPFPKKPVGRPCWCDSSLQSGWKVVLFLQVRDTSPGLDGTPKCCHG